MHVAHAADERLLPRQQRSLHTGEPACFVLVAHRRATTLRMHAHAAMCTLPCSSHVHSLQQRRVLQAATRGLSVCRVTQPYTLYYIVFMICCI